MWLSYSNMVMPFQSTEMSMHHSDALCWFGQILLEVGPVPYSRAWHAPLIGCGHLRSHVDLLPISFCYGHVKYIAISIRIIYCISQQTLMWTLCSIYFLDYQCSCFPLYFICYNIDTNLPLGCSIRAFRIKYDLFNAIHAF